jgi:predicted metal-dependent enzyme (double-stranded beta helix superfamily)
MEVKSLEELTNLCDSAYKETRSLLKLYDTSKLKIKLDYKQYVSYSDLNYKRNLICNSECVDIYLICWKEGQKSKIHDHPDGGCLMVMLEGELQEIKYNKDEHETISYVATNIIKPGDNAYNSGSTVLHQITALKPSISLHIYHKNYVPKYY